MMIGPSAPNGPPDPIEIADDKRLEQRDLRLDAAAVDQNRLDGLGNAVAADALRSVPRHEADDERADHRHDDDEQAEVVAGRRDERRVEPLKEEEVREEPDELGQRQRDVRRGHTDHDRETRDEEDPGARCEIAEMMEAISAGGHSNSWRRR